MAGPAPTGPNPIAKAIEDTAKHYTTLSLSFLLVCLYVGVTAASTTHRDLLLGSSLTLPLLNVAIPLTGFYIVAPTMLAGLHAHLLLQEYVLIRRLGHQRIKDLRGDEDFFLFPALPVIGQVSGRGDGWVRRLIYFSLFGVNVGLPILTLCLVQYEFLPYHSFLITLWHQILVTGDLVIVWYFLVVLAPRKSPWRWWTLAKRLVAILAAGCVLYFSLCLAILPGAWIEQLVGKRFQPELKRNLSLSGELLISEAPSAEVLAAFEAKGESREAAFLRHAIGAKLQGRDLRGADLDDAKLFNADFRGADLRDAWLVGADLRGALLTPTGVSELIQQKRGIQKSESVAHMLEGRRLDRAVLDGATLRGVRLEDAKLILVSLRGADLEGVNLAGLELTGADLRNANLQGSHLKRVELSYADLSYSNLTRAKLVAATLDHALLVGAVLNDATADGASFIGANLGGAQLARAQLKLVDFREAILTGSDFRRASLQGARAPRLNVSSVRAGHLGGVCGLSWGTLTDLRSVNFDFLPDATWSELRGQIFGESDTDEERWQSMVALLAQIEKSESIEMKDELEELIEISVQAQCRAFVERGGASSEAECQSILTRFSEAMKVKTEGAQAICIGTPLGRSDSVKSRGLFYYDEQRTGVLQNWPQALDSKPASKIDREPWDESAFHVEVAHELLDYACTNTRLARALALRAAGNYTPSDFEFEAELGGQMLRRLEKENCLELKRFPNAFREQLIRRLKWRLKKMRHQVDAAKAQMVNSHD